MYFFDCLTQIVADFVISGWVGWLAGLRWAAGLGWLAGLGWVGLGPAETTKAREKIQKMMIPARPKGQKKHRKYQECSFSLTQKIRS